VHLGEEVDLHVRVCAVVSGGGRGGEGVGGVGEGGGGGGGGYRCRLWSRCILRRRGRRCR